MTFLDAARSPFSLIAPNGQLMQAVFFVAIDGAPVTANFLPLLLSMSIKDTQGGKSDSLEIELDDSYGQIVLPRVGAMVTAGIGWSETGPVQLFQGKTDEPRSNGSRSAGRTLTISAKSADPQSKVKQTAHKHKDKASFHDVASQWASDAGLSGVQIDSSLASIQRDYWWISGENYMNWLSRIAAEMGATAKIMGTTAVVVPRGSSASASGLALSSVDAVWGENLLSWSMAPIMSRLPYQTYAARWYDVVNAKWMIETAQAAPQSDDSQSATLTHRYKHASQQNAKGQAGSNKAEAAKDSGGGSVSIVGNPAAQSQAMCNVSGARPGVDGSYLIESATHKLSRSSGYVTDLELKQPGGAAGTDSR